MFHTPVAQLTASANVSTRILACALRRVDVAADFSLKLRSVSRVGPPEDVHPGTEVSALVSTEVVVAECLLASICLRLFTMPLRIKRRQAARHALYGYWQSLPTHRS